MTRSTTIRRTRRHPCAAGHSNAPPKDLAPCPCGCGDQLLPDTECIARRELRGARFDIGDGVRVAATREQRRVTSGPIKVTGGFEVETMLDTLLANFPKGSLVAIIGDPAAYSGPRVCGLPADRRLLPNYMRTLRALARVDEVSMAVVCRAPKARETDIYSIPMDVSTIVDVLVSANDDGSYTVLKNRHGRSLYRIEPTTAPALPDLIPESAMTNDDYLTR